MAAIVVALLLVGALILTRTMLARRDERACAARLPTGPSGIIVGAEPFELSGGPRAVLLLHGFADTPQSLRYLAEYLGARGWTVRVPLLPGHGRTLRDFAASRADAWIAHARAEFTTLRSRFDTVVLCGQSMGGALGLVLAAQEPALPALVLIAPYVGMTPLARRVARLHAILGAATVYVRGRGEQSIRDPAEAARTLGYGYTTPRLVAELATIVRRALDAASRVAAPTLVIQSRHDNRIPRDAATDGFARLGARDKTLEWTTGAGHVLTVDYGREQVFAMVADWLEHHIDERAARRD